MTWALYMLAECSHIQNAARAEVTEIAGNAPFAATMLKDMGAIRNIFRETLRLYPPVAFFPREVTCPMPMRDKQTIGRAHVCTPVTNEHLVCRLQLEKNI